MQFYSFKQLMVLSYLQVICSTIIAATFQATECKSHSYPPVVSVANENYSEIVFEQWLSSQLTVQEAYLHFGCPGIFPKLHRLQCFAMQSVVCWGTLLAVTCLLITIVFFLTSTPYWWKSLFWLFSHQMTLITLLTLWVWAFQTDVLQ